MSRKMSGDGSGTSTGQPVPMFEKRSQIPSEEKTEKIPPIEGSTPRPNDANPNGRKMVKFSTENKNSTILTKTIRTNRAADLRAGLFQHKLTENKKPDNNYFVPQVNYTNSDNEKSKSYSKSVEKRQTNLNMNQDSPRRILNGTIGVGVRNNTVNRTKDIKDHPPSVIEGSSGSSWEKSFPVIGQGIIIFNINRQTSFSISVQGKGIWSVEESCKNWISVDIHLDCVLFYMKKDGILKVLTKTNAKQCGLENAKTSYWFSYDRDNLVLKYGKGYRMVETTLLTFDFLKGKSTEKRTKIRKNLEQFFNAREPKWTCLYDLSPEITAFSTGKLSKSVIEVEPEFEFERNPFVRNLSPFVLDSSEVNLFRLDKGNYMFSASLPKTCRELYENVKDCELECRDDFKGFAYDDNIAFSDAIRYSINTKGCILKNKLVEKGGKFSYLRITLGNSVGNSPGIPYVLEIWPSHHYSPIHNHGNTNAVIKVLFGNIHVQIYNKNTSILNTKPILEFDASRGDTTWINRNWYQTHKLVNTSDDFCATIQCYTYDDEENIHWPYFDYVSNEETIELFEPNSDFEFYSMRKTVIEEYKRSKEYLMKVKKRPLPSG